MLVSHILISSLLSSFSLSATMTVVFFVLILSLYFSNILFNTPSILFISFSESATYSVICKTGTVYFFLLIVIPLFFLLFLLLDLRRTNWVNKGTEDNPASLWLSFCFGLLVLFHFEMYTNSESNVCPSNEVPVYSFETKSSKTVLSDNNFYTFWRCILIVILFLCASSNIDM